MSLTAAPVPDHHQEVNPPENAAARVPRGESTAPCQSALIGALSKTTAVPGEINRSFFSPAQAHVEEPAQPASDATNTPSPNAKEASCGMVPRAQPGRTSKGGWSPQTASRSVSTGRCPKAAPRRAIPRGTVALAAENQTMAPNLALVGTRRNACSPYDRDAWATELSRHGLQSRYPLLVEGLEKGFHLGIPTILRTYTPPNHHSIHPLPEVYNAIVQKEFAAGRYFGPFTRAQVEAKIGPFQSSPLSLVPKTSKPGQYRAVHDFSHPHHPSSIPPAINSGIDSDAFPCTWGTFSTIILLIARLPLGSQASVRDVAEAYRTIPAAPSQWPGLVIRLQATDQFAINTCNNFGLTSAGGVYGMVADAGADIFRGLGMGPVAKWVDDHIFFRIPRATLPEYNKCRSIWRDEIQAAGGRRQSGSRVWYGGKDLPSGSPEEFDENCSTPLLDLTRSPSGPIEDRGFHYTASHIDEVSTRLGIRWEPSKTIPFATEVPYLGFRWDLHARRVYLPEEKRAKYLAAITTWEAVRAHNLLETQRLKGVAGPDSRTGGGGGGGPPEAPKINLDLPNSGIPNQEVIHPRDSALANPPNLPRNLAQNGL